MKNHRILIVDDEPDNIRAIRNCFIEADAPYTIYQALNGEFALTVAQAELPDLIVTDWEMPSMDGIELIKRLKENKDTADIPVIMCTGVMTTSENLQMALEAGAVDYIRKPIDKIELIARVQSMLQLADSKKSIREKYLVIEKKNRFITSLMESIPFPIVYYKPDGKIKGANAHFENQFQIESAGYSKINVYNIPLFSINEISKADQQLMLSKSNYTREITCADKVFLFNNNLFYNSTGTPKGIFCILTDITELKNAHQEILEAKKKELASNALRLLQLNEKNSLIKKELEKSLKHSSLEKESSLRAVINQLDNIANEKLYREFDIHFSSVFENFYKTLKDRFPILTPGELKLCAFLRLNLASKEIAAFTFQNPKSIDMARYRLRKKMNLPKDCNLNNYLMRIN